jgi:hypothetical protein
MSQFTYIAIEVVGPDDGTRDGTTVLIPAGVCPRCGVTIRNAGWPCIHPYHGDRSLGGGLSAGERSDVLRELDVIDPIDVAFVELTLLELDVLALEHVDDQPGRGVETIAGDTPGHYLESGQRAATPPRVLIETVAGHPFAVVAGVGADRHGDGEPVGVLFPRDCSGAERLEILELLDVWAPNPLGEIDLPLEPAACVNCGASIRPDGLCSSCYRPARIDRAARGECAGHPCEDAGDLFPHAGIGETFYCDGTCQS